MTRVFVSSVHMGMQDYRAAVSDACVRLGITPVVMDEYVVEPARPLERSLSSLDSSDLVVLLVGHRYGAIPRGESRSFVELEYQRARQLGRPVLTFIVDPAQPWPVAQFDRGASGDEFERFVDRLKSEQVVAFFTTPDDLRLKVLAALRPYVTPAQTRSGTGDVALAYLDRVDPAAVAACELAIALSPAAFVEPSLARAVRLDALPHLVAEAEADLWFSPLVRDRTADGISFEPAAVPALHQRLRSWLKAGGATRNRAERAAATILGRKASDLRLVAERVTWWSLSPDDSTADRIGAELAPVLAALRSGSTAHARWAQRTLPTLPDAARSVTAVAEVAARASYLTQTGVDAFAPAAGAFDEIDLALPTVEVAVRRRGSSLDIGTFAAQRATGIRLPVTRPLHVAVTAGGRTQVVTFSSGESRTVDVGPGPVGLRTLNGDSYHLPAAAPTPAPPPTHEPVSKPGSAVPVNRDLVVVIPGLLGSRLRRQNRVLWGGTTSQLVRAMWSLNDLLLPADAGDDGVRADGVLTDIGLLPGLWSVSGYGRLIDTLGKRDAQRVVGFAWDWRRDIRQAAQRLQVEILDELDRWRAAEGGPDARLVLVGHGEGGLVAGHFLAQLGGWEFTRLFIPIGTPFRGTVRALEQLVNGARPGIGALRLDLTTLIRSLQPLYQTLPTFRTVDTGDGQVRRLDDVVLPGLDRERVLEGRRFLDGVGAMVVPSGDHAILPVVGINQPTAYFARQVGDRLDTDDPEQDGDGVVPRFSALPSGSGAEPQTFYVSDRHGALQSNPRVVDFIAAALVATGTIPDGIGRTSVPRSGVIQIPDAFGPLEEVTGHVRVPPGAKAEFRVVDLTTNRRVTNVALGSSDDFMPFTLNLPRDSGPLYRISLVIGSDTVADAEFAVLDDQP